MEFLENIKKITRDTAQSGLKKAEELVKKSKVKYSVYDLKNEIEQRYIQLGKAVYNSYKTDENISEFVESKCAEIDAVIEQKTHLLEEMESYKKSVIYEYVTGKKEVM